MATDPAISAQLIVAGIAFKLAKDSDGNTHPVAELKLLTDDLGAAGRLAWHLGQVVDARLQPLQPPLDDFDEFPDTDIERAIDRVAGSEANGVSVSTRRVRRGRH